MRFKPWHRRKKASRSLGMPSKPASFTQEARYTTGLVVPPMGRPSQALEFQRWP